MQSTPVCQWTLWRVTGWSAQAKTDFSFFLLVPAFSGKSLKGWLDIGRGKKKKTKVSKSHNQARQRGGKIRMCDIRRAVDVGW